MTGGRHDDAAARARMFAIRADKNKETTLGFILGLVALGLVFAAFHLVRQASHWARRPRGPSVSGKTTSSVAAVPRWIRKLGLRRVAGLPSLGHATIVTLFSVLNMAALFVNMDDKNASIVSNVASRSGWLAIANLLFVIFFALKNTPLAFLTAWSYERLNCLHRVTGYAAVGHAVVHAACYSYYFVHVGRPGILVRPSDVAGIVAGAAWVLLALAAVFIRPWWYELFYGLHVVLWVVSLVALGFHRPDLVNRVAVGTVVAGAMWGLDRVIRLVRLVLNAVNNSAALTPLPNGGTRITLAKKPLGSTRPGKHALVWIPSIRLLQTHPFTIASADPLEFVVASRDGFTAALHKYATAHPGTRLRASIDGPYGTVPDPSAFETVVLLAGGSGASFTFGLADRLLNGAPVRSMTRRVVFVWAVKHRSQVKWFSERLATFPNDARFSVQLYITRADSSSSSPPQSLSEPEKEARRWANWPLPLSTVDLEKAKRWSDGDANSNSGDDAAARPVDPDALTGASIRHQRPDVAGIIREAVGGTAAHERVLVSGCGPARMMDEMRGTAVGCVRGGGPSVELHCEEFGW